MHALIIEDAVAEVDRIEQALRMLGYSSFDTAFSAAEARAAAHSRCPDLITADLNLVDGSGVETVLEICADKAIPVVFISVHRREIGSLLPAAVVVDKPLAYEALRPALARAVGAPLSNPPMP